AVLVTAAYMTAHVLRFEGHISPSGWMTIHKGLVYLVPFKLVCFYFFGLYRGMWRYTSIADLKNIFLAVSVSSGVIVLFILYQYRFHGYSRSVYLIDWGLTFLLAGGIRVFIRIMLGGYFRSARRMESSPRSLPVKKLLIIGAGNAAEKVLREINETPWSRFTPVGLLDDDRAKRGKAIHGVPVLGTVDEIERLRVSFDELLIAMPSVKGEVVRRIIGLCEKTGKRFRTLPGIWELVEGKVSIKTVRDVTLEDILNRGELHLDEEGIKQYLERKRVLVTGAGGSIGSELVRQVGRFDPEAVALLDFSEYNLFRLEIEFKQRFSFVPESVFLTDIKNKDAVRRAFSAFNPDVVLHAAAYKHVPMQELNPWEAVYNNILGTRNLIDVSLEAGVKRFVLVSTDKAVRPANVMGATKRVAEMLTASVNGDPERHFMAVRFGNVIGSSGSVIPLFQEQISRGSPVTVTHPDVTRYFMSIPEAAQLILQAGALGNGKEIFVLDMGEPVRIADLARDLIRLNGLEPERDIPIQFIGLRPGEKLYEELITDGEKTVPTEHTKILVLQGEEYNGKALNKQIDRLLAIADTYDAAAIKQKLHEIVPEYTPQGI
ncbi:MAG: nucleoside-diphosphate sugar epimerase/dehydratase, partial [Syntrophaceae bacterium]|nr:nucleoside-diphosphate sugar epimerase/dehydratase [Syntrophaceae bacterium]